MTSELPGKQRNSFPSGGKMIFIKRAPIRQVLVKAGCLSLCLAMAGCASETIFLSSFNASAEGTAPAATQAVGSATLSGSVSIVNQPGPTPEHWVRIARQAADNGISAFYGRFSKAPPDGHYGILLAIKVGGDLVGNVPANTDLGAASVEIRPDSSDLPYLLHLDFLPKQPQGKMIRINDDPSQAFGTFAVDEKFSISIGIDVHGGTATGAITLFGSGVSNDIARENIPLDLRLGSPPGALQLWVGYPWAGHFDAADIIVTYKP
jgi:hypothetical protein